MAVEIIYGYIVDEGMFKERNLLAGTPEEISPGIINTNIRSFFKNPVVATALHADRYTNLPDYETGDGDINIVFDRLYSPLFATKIDMDPRSADTINIFNIVEYLLRSGCLTTATQAELETFLVTNTGNVFTGYVPNTMSVSRELVEGEWNSVQSDPAKFEFETSITFVFTDGVNDYTFNLYVDPDTFVDNYVHSTIGQVIAPCDPVNMIQTNFQTTLDAIIVTGTYVNDQIKLASESVNYTNNIVYLTDHNREANTTPGFPFGIMYHGKEPTVDEQRNAIRQFLLDSGAASEAEWTQIFPEIYTDNRFMIIPMWENVHPLPGFDLTKCMLPITSAIGDIKTLFSTIDPTVIDGYADLVVAPNGYTFLISIPDGAVKSHMTELHPTYQSCDSTGVMYGYQTEETKLFNERLSACLAQLNGRYNTYVFKKSEFYGRAFYTFYVGTVEYCVMTKQLAP